MLEALRYVAVALAVLALMLLGADVVATLQADGEVKVASLKSIWALVSVPSEASESASPLSAVIAMIWSAPSWLVPGVLATAIAYLTRRAGSEA